MINFFKKLFGGMPKPKGDDRGMYFYVRPKRCKEVLRVRVDPMNELSQDEDGHGYFVRKQVRGASCPFAAELHVSFDLSHRVIDTVVTDGELVSKAEWERQQADNPV